MPFKTWIAALAAARLAACGGGGDDGSSAAPPAATADVALSLSAPGYPIPGGNVTQVNLTVTNAGSAPAADVVLAPGLGTGLSVTAIVCVEASGGATCPTATGLPIRVPSLPAGGSLTFQLNTLTAAGASGRISSSPQVTAANDANSANNQVLFTLDAYSADVSVTGSGPSTPVAAGSVATYTMTVSNAGPDAARDVLLADSLDANQAIGAIGCVASGGATCPATVGTSMVVPLLPANGALTFTVPATVPTGASGTISNILTATSAGDPLGGNNAHVAQGTIATTAPALSGTSITLQSDFGDYIGDGRSYAYTRANASLSVTSLNGRLTVNVAGDEDWTGEFALPSTQTQFQPGTYDNLARYPFHQASVGGLSWTGEGRGCNTLVGSIVVRSATYSGSQLTAIDLDFVQHCEGGTPALRGTIRWAASDTSTPPGPVNPPPAGLWSPAAGVTPSASVSHVYLESDFGDYIGAGRSYAYTKANAALNISASGGRISVGVGGDEDWSGEFQAMNGLSQFQPGYYGSLQRYPFHNPVRGGLSWSGEGRGCNTLTGWFVVDSISYVNGAIGALDLRFEQHCEGGTAALRGKIHWVPGDSTAPAGPVNPPPAGLWAPPAGSTPASGNYVHLVSDPGDYIGAGQTHTYTPADATIGVTTATGRLSVSVAGWYADFQAMNGLAQLEPGYYGDLSRYPFHNTTKGGLDWTGNGRGCNTLTGWFVVDSVSYVGGVLQSIDLRFEQHCEGATPALRGKLHWVPLEAP
jgi:uncharacterized repeat protein (TIGR01451 family)